ncbi:glycoside hydrolase family 15 protein [Actinomadura madurae]|uniref:glycoside hydrolase family 15 protein n=1 Tax=Actinomadura madurae TaxID=1993 RepID=UPI002026EF86|nr:glycoside hydrolase family 15 protein [Actinomadura madurae]MCP9950718.1 glycoside hydrolase family 15 [Actinomadura madurae]MCQ0008522.1 glycoside hydrolase family 15 [Actinomadura madurae]URM96251.1 glycoside hydrolase family 15 [Actinomadura madurae]URN06957.1 glycoside hydrolase family 15 [Actinomadura madurae]
MAMAEERDTSLAAPVPATPVLPVPPPPRRGPARRRPASRRRSRLRTVRRTAAMLVVAALVATGGVTVPEPPGPGWASPGLVGGGGWPFAGVPLPPDQADGASYLPDSSVIKLADGRIRLIPSGGDTPVTVGASDPRVARAVRSDSAWLAQGTIPGGPDGSHRDMAARALLDLRLLTRPNGASLASWYSKWRYCWPRDSAFTVAAFTVTGHTSEARRVLRFLARAQNENGMWAARYNADGTAVADGRAPQLDSLGWVLWAAWFYRVQSRDAGELPALWPMVRRAADHLARSLDAEGLPPASSDYWERDHRREQDPRRPTLGVVGPALAGLRAAADLAGMRGEGGKAAEWRHAARRVSDAVDRQFAPYGYPRSPIPGGLMDTSVTFLAPPFAHPDPGVTVAIGDAARKQALPNGGVLPGERWSGDPDVAWTPETALFGLNAAASGRTGDALSRLAWLSAHRTSLGVLPEKVGVTGKPAGPAPLGWTASLVLLSLSALERPLPIP